MSITAKIDTNITRVVFSQAFVHVSDTIGGRNA